MKTLVFWATNGKIKPRVHERTRGQDFNIRDQDQSIGALIYRDNKNTYKVVDI